LILPLACETRFEGEGRALLGWGVHVLTWGQAPMDSDWERISSLMPTRARRDLFVEGLFEADGVVSCFLSFALKIRFHPPHLHAITLLNHAAFKDRLLRISESTAQMQKLAVIEPESFYFMMIG